MHNKTWESGDQRHQSLTRIYRCQCACICCRQSAWPCSLQGTHRGISRRRCLIRWPGIPGHRPTLPQCSLASRWQDRCANSA